MKLKLTDKIKKFFGQAEHQEVDAVLDGDVPAYGGSLEASVANLAALKPSPARHDAQLTHQQHIQVQQRPGCQPVCQDQLHAGGAAAEKQAASQLQLLQHGQHTPQIASCTNSQKDAKDFCSGLRTTGQDESYTLQNEVYFPQLLLTLQGGTPEQKAVAAEALFNYTAESDAARQRATQAGVVAHLVDLLRTGTEHGKMYAAYTLSSLTTIDESLEQMHKHGAIPALIDILSTCPLLVCKKGAMRALGRLARSDDAAQEIVAAGGLGPIISLLSRPDSSLVRRCLIALYFIGADKDSLQQAIGAAGALPQLLQLVRSDSPDVQAEATDVLKVLCRNAACGRMLAELNGIEVLVCTAQSGLTSRAKAAATRALQRLHDVPELKEALSGSTACNLQPDASMSPAHSSQLNSSTAAPAAAAFSAAAAAGSPQAAAPLQSPAAAAAASVPAQGTAAMQLSVGQTGQAAAPAGGNAGAVQNAGVAAGPVFTVSGSRPEDLKQLAQVLTAGSSRWLREKAAAAVEQLATDNPAACRDLVGLGVIPALLDMLDASNSGSTRRAAARALGQLSDDAVLLVGMADAGVVSQLLLAAPQLAGSAQQGVMRVLHSLASVPNAVSTCFQRQAVHSMMQVLDSNPAGASAVVAAEGVQRSTMSGGSAPDTGVTSRALEVLLAVCRSDALALQEIKDYPGGFKLLVSQLQHGQRSTASLILQLLAVLAQHRQHQEDLLKCGVVPTLLLMYRSDDSAVALQAARIMESLSEPASTILQRSLSASNSRMPDSSSDTSASSTPTAAGQQGSASTVAQQAAPQQAGPEPQQQQDPASSSSEANPSFVTGGSGSSSAGGQGEPSTAAAVVQQPQEPSLSPLGQQSKPSSRLSSAPSPRQPGVQGQEPSALGKPSNAMAAASTSSTAAQAAASPAAQQDTPSSTAAVAAATTAAAEEPTVQLTAVSRKGSLEGYHQPPGRSNSSSPPRRVAAVAAALEAAALASAGSSAGDTSLPLPPSPTAGRSRQSSIPLLNRNGRQTPTGLGSAPLVARRPSKSEPPSDLQQQQQPRQQDQQLSASNQEQREEPSPSTSQQQPQQQQQQAHAQQEALQQEVQQPQQQPHPQQQQHRVQQQMPSRLPRRLPVAPGSGSGAAGSSSSSPGATPDPSSSRTSTPEPMKRKQYAAAAAAAAAGVSKVPSGSNPGGASSPASGRSPSGSAVHFRVLAAQKKSQRNLSAAGDANSEAPAAAAAPGASQQQQQQQPREGTSSGRVMQMAAALAANAEAAARSPTPEHGRQPAQSQPQRQQQQQQELQAKQENAAAAASAADAARPSGSPSSSSSPGKSSPSSPGSSSRPSSASSPSKGDRQAAAASPPAPAAAAGSSQANACQPGPSPTPAAAALGQDRVRPSAGAAAAGSPAAAEADDLLSSTYDNLHGLLLKKGDIEICRTAEGRKCRLGEGGFGIVYKAVMNGVDEVAVKLVKAETPSRKELELFLKEVQTLAKLHHRNIVQFYGACLEMGSMFFVTELMKGGDLYSALRHHAETMKWERLGRKVALDVALGLNYLHAQRPPMMHRDLKSPNVLLSEEGVAKIADVGMVRSQVKDLVTAQPVMTPLWAAPEVVRHERASIKADIWSYGILIWELVTGEDITEYQPLSISRQVGPSPNAKAMALPARCPAVARKLFVACTQMDPERRPCAQQLVEWLRADIAQSRH